MRRLFAALSVIVLAACAAEDLSRPPEPMGDFAVGYTIVVAKNAQAVGPSRKATTEEWEYVLKTALEKHFGRYDGDKLYHIGVTVDAYALAIPGVPVVLNPKSVLAINVNVWDDTAGRKINAEPEQLTVFQSLSGETVIGSGLTQNRKEQMEDLAANAADDINDWLLRNKAWFTPEAAAARASLAAAEGTAPKPSATTN